MVNPDNARTPIFSSRKWSIIQNANMLIKWSWLCNLYLNYRLAIYFTIKAIGISGQYFSLFISVIWKTDVRDVIMTRDVIFTFYLLCYTIKGFVKHFPHIMFIAFSISRKQNYSYHDWKTRYSQHMLRRQKRCKICSWYSVIWISPL